VHAPRVHHHEHDADHRGEEDVDGGRNQFLDVRPHLLQLAERFAAALVLEDRVGQFEGVPDAVRVDLRAEPLRDDVDEVILEILGNPRDERHAHGREQQEADAAEELSCGVLRESGRIPVDDVTEDQGIQEREDLVDRGKDESERNQRPVAFKVRGKDLHRASIAVGLVPGHTLS